MSGKTYFSNKQQGLNKNGIRPQAAGGQLSATVPPRGRHFLATEGGWIKPHLNQTAWRIRCAQVGSCGYYEITLGNETYTIEPGVSVEVDFTLDAVHMISIERVGMHSNDWGALVISRVF